MKKTITTLLLLGLALALPSYAKIQQQGIKTAADCVAAGAALGTCLPLDSQIYVTANGINEQLSAAITSGLIGGAGGGGINLIANPDFEVGVNTNWAVTGGTLASVTSGANLILGSVTASFVASTTGQFLNSTAQAVPEALIGGQCLAQIYYKYGGGAGDYSFQIDNGAGTLLSAALPLPVSANPSLISLPLFNCGSGNVRLQIVSNIGSPSIIYVDHVYVGEVKFGKIKGVTDAAASYSTILNVPYSQFTKVDANNGLIETGNTNILINPSFEAISGATASGWTTSGATLSASSNFHDGKSAASLALTAAGSLSQDVTPATNTNGTNLEAGAWVNTTAAGVTVCARLAGATLTGNYCNSVPASGNWQYVSANFVGPSSGSVGIAVVWTGSSGTVIVDQAYLGQAKNISQVSQAQFIGSVTSPGTASCVWDRTSTSYGAYSATSACPVATAAGQAQAPSTKIPAITFPSLAPGTYNFLASGTFNVVASDNCYWQFTDGTNSFMAGSISSSGTNTKTSTMVGTITYTTAQTNVTISMQAASVNGVGSCEIQNSFAIGAFSIATYYFPSQGQIAINASSLHTPTKTVLTSGSGTYTPPAGVTSIHVHMVGGGGGGGAGTGGGGGGTGGLTNLSTIASAFGGNPGNSSGPGTGGSCSIGSGLTGVCINGGNGGSGSSAANFADNSGGNGGASAYGGQGSTGSGSIVNAATNSGSGGAGLYNSGTGTNGGVGGGAGGYVEVTVPNPVAVAYTVGAGGTAGSGGNGAGGSGIIIIDETYGYGAPLVIGGLATSSKGSEKLDRIELNTGTGAVASQSNPTWTISSAGSGVATLNFNGSYSAAPTCICTNNAGSSRGCSFSSVPTSTSGIINTFISQTGAADNDNVSIVCSGPN